MSRIIPDGERASERDKERSVSSPCTGARGNPVQRQGRARAVAGAIRLSGWRSTLAADQFPRPSAGAVVIPRKWFTDGFLICYGVIGGCVCG